MPALPAGLSDLGRAVEERLAAATGREAKIAGSQGVGGGCIHSTAVLTLQDGRSFFLKYNASAPADMFEREVEGLAVYPFLSKTTFDGEESSSFQIEEIEANPELDPALFERPPEL